jgi:hypothetical protein
MNLRAPPIHNIVHFPQYPPLAENTDIAVVRPNWLTDSMEQSPSWEANITQLVKKFPAFH